MAKLKSCIKWVGLGQVQSFMFYSGLGRVESLHLWVWLGRVKELDPRPTPPWLRHSLCVNVTQDVRQVHLRNDERGVLRSTASAAETSAKVPPEARSQGTAGDDGHAAVRGLRSSHGHVRIYYAEEGRIRGRETVSKIFMYLKAFVSVTGSWQAAWSIEVWCCWQIRYEVRGNPPGLDIFSQRLPPPHCWIGSSVRVSASFQKPASWVG